MIMCLLAGPGQTFVVLIFSCVSFFLDVSFAGFFYIFIVYSFLYLVIKVYGNMHVECEREYMAV